MHVLGSKLSGRLFSKAVAMVAIVLLAGCYTYAETSLETLSPGIQTRVRLDADGFGRVANQAAMNGVPVQTLDLAGRGVSGRLISLDPGAMMVEMRGIGGSVFAADIPMHAVEGVAIRSFSPRRTLLAVGIGAAVSGLVFSGTVGGSLFPGDGDGGEMMTFPLFGFGVP